VQVGAFIPLAIFIAVIGSVGWKTLALWRRSGQRPELALGLSLCSLCSGLLLSAIGRLPALAMELTGRVCFGLGMASVAIGLCLLFDFTASVFQRRLGWQRILLACVWSGLGILAIAIIVANFRAATLAESMTRIRPLSMGIVSAIAICFAWNASESLVYYNTLRRRMTLGLSDPVLVNRFLLWGLSGALACGLLVVILGFVEAKVVLMREPIPLTVLAATGSVLSISWYLTFFSPLWYRRIVRDRAAKLLSP
jgi:hypothetical protein